MNGIISPDSIIHVQTSNGGFVSVGSFPGNLGKRVVFLLDITDVDSTISDVAEIDEKGTCANCLTRACEPEKCLFPDDLGSLPMGNADELMRRLKMRALRFCPGYIAQDNTI